MAKIVSVRCHLHCICGAEKTIDVKVPKNGANDNNALCEKVAKITGWIVKPSKKYDLCRKAECRASKAGRR